MVKYIFIYFEMNQNKLKIINSNEDDIKQFKSVDEFNLFYRTNKEMMDTKTTQWLNKNYSIITDNGDIYRITKLNTRDNEGRRQQGEICLKKVKNKNDHGSFEQTIEPEPQNDGPKGLSREAANLQNDLINEIDSRNQELQHKIKSKLKLYDEKMKHFDAFINELSSKINKMDKVLTQVVNIINGSSQLR